MYIYIYIHTHIQLYIYLYFSASLLLPEIDLVSASDKWKEAPFYHEEALLDQEGGGDELQVRMKVGILGDLQRRGLCV